MKGLGIGFLIFLATFLFFDGELQVMISMAIGFGLLFIAVKVSIKRDKEKKKWFANQEKISFFDRTTGLLFMTGIPPFMIPLLIMYVQG